MMEQIRLQLPGEDKFFIQEAYKVLRTNLQFCGRDIRVVALTSCNEGEGKTTVTLSLGRSLAELQRRVLIIDTDMRKSVMARRNTSAGSVSGLSEVLTGQREYDECIYGTEQEGLHILFAGKYPPNPVELLDGSDFPALLARCRQDYDYILIDTPPLGRVIDAAVIAPHCDGTILVIGDRDVRRGQAQEVVNQLQKSGSKILGVVRNHTGKKK